MAIVPDKKARARGKRFAPQYRAGLSTNGESPLWRGVCGQIDWMTGQGVHGAAGLDVELRAAAE